MPKRRKKTEDLKFHTKKGEKRSSVLRRLEAQARSRGKKGTALTGAWEKGGKEVNIDPVPPPFLRRDMREASFGEGSGRRVGFTVPALDVRKSRSRRRNQIAKASRKANR